MKLGKLAPKHVAHVPSLDRLMAGPLPVAREKRDWTGKLTKSPMFLNDTLGCCTIATMAHITRIWTSQVWGQEMDIPDDLIRSTYFHLTGGADDGLAETDVLAFWARQGFVVPGRQYEDILSGWSTLRHEDPNHIKLAVGWFGAAYIGIGLPLTAQGAETWVVTDPHLQGDAAPSSWGGHAVPIVAYDAEWATVLTWGAPLKASWQFLAAYMDEAHAPISRTWLDTAGSAPNNIDLAHLKTCMSLIAR